MKEDCELVIARINVVLQMLDVKLLLEVERLIRGYINARGRRRKEE